MSVVTSAAPRARRDPGVTLWALTGAGWLAMVVLAFLPAAGMAGMPAMTAGVLAGGPGTGSLSSSLALFTGGWLVMIAAMMLPTTVPMARMFAVVSAVRTSPGPARAAFSGAYIAVWLAFGAAGLAGATALQLVLGGRRPDLVLAAALALAGAVQFSPLTKRCLALCRDPRAFLFARYRRGIGGAWAVGVRHALACVGCCWALMLVMFATGVGGLVWMLGLTAVMVVQKVARWGHRIAAPVGVALLIAAVLLAVAGVGAPASGMTIQ